MAAIETFHVVGFVSDSGIGGYEWRTDRYETSRIRDAWIAWGDADVSDIVTVKGDFPDAEAVVEHLEANADLWEPTEGQGR